MHTCLDLVFAPRWGFPGLHLSLGDISSTSFWTGLSSTVVVPRRFPLEVRLGSPTATLTLRTSLSVSWVTLITRAKRQLLHGTLSSLIKTMSSCSRLRLGRIHF